jgi:diguanylate cyclase (GGDEF)-like protein
MVLLTGLGVIDHVTGPELSISILYLMPVLLASWYVGRRAGVVLATLSTLTWLIADFTAGAHYTRPEIRYLNAAGLYGFLLIIALMFASLRHAFARERALSRVDFLTGVANARAFSELAELEKHRARRYAHPITVAYVDIDDFKQINDRFGHPTGDALLVWVGKTLRENLRDTDAVARIGGDEFAILLPETGEQAGDKVLQKLHAVLQNRMDEHGWPVTFSIGAVTFMSAPDTLDEMVSEADRLMYAAKRAGKNRVQQAVIA